VCSSDLDDAHLAAILTATDGGRRISHILVTHSHVDHSPLARPLSEVTGAPVLAFGDSGAGRSARMANLSLTADLGGGEGVDHAFWPDQRLADGDVLKTAEWQVRAIATPGHFSNHLCFAWQDCLFSGDHVMGWATTLVSPPDGDLTAFMQSLARLQGRNDRRYYPGHGGPVEDPEGMLAHQIAHRKSREAQILEALKDGPATPMALARRIYTEIPPALIPAAARNVFSHLLDLFDRNLAETELPIAVGNAFRLRKN